MKTRIGQVTPEERDEIRSLFERKNGLIELSKIINDNDTIYERVVTDMGKTSMRFERWWGKMGEKYQWQSAPDGHWEINFDTCEIYLITN